MYALNIDPANPKGNPSVAELKKLGVQAVRFSYKDSSAGDKPDPAQLQFYTTQVEALYQAGIAALIIFTHESFPGAPATDAPADAWATYIHHFARRAGQVARATSLWMSDFQIWNEPDLPQSQTPYAMPPAIYGQMLKQAYTVIKSVDPDIRVLTAGLASGNSTWLRQVAWSLGGNTLPADAVAVHPYGQRPQPDFPTPTWGFGNLGDLLIRYRRAGALPLVITEVGTEDLNPIEQAEYLRRFYNRIGQDFRNIVDEVYWFCYSDNMVEPFGLIDRQGQRKPSYYVFRSLAAPPLDANLTPVMDITISVNRADYDNLRRNYAQLPAIPADVTIDGTLFSGAKLTYRDLSSINYPKKGLAIEFPAENLFRENTRRLDLSAGYPDKSLIRERLCFDLFAETSVPAPAAWHAHVTIRAIEGGVLLEHGLFTALEHIDPAFFQRRNRTAGALYHATGGIVNGEPANAILDPQPEPTLRTLYQKRNAKPDAPTQPLMARLFGRQPVTAQTMIPESYADLTALITDINRWGAGVIDRYLENIFDVDVLIDWLAVNTLVQSNDTYTKNYFLHNRMEDDRWEILPWDYDLTFGRNWNDYCGGLCDDLSAGTSIKGSTQMLNELTRRVLENPVYFERLKTRLHTLLTEMFTAETLSTKIDALYTQISPYVYTDTLKWASNLQFEQERERLKDWIDRRRTFLLRAIAPPETPPVPGDNRPDTIVTRVWMEPPVPAHGDAVTFSATVRNQGAGDTGAVVGVAFLVDGVYITFGTSPQLSSGADRTIRAVSTWTATTGTHRLTAVVDDVNRYPEVSETNNTLETTFQVSAAPVSGLADVLVRDIAFERTPDGQIRLAALVANNGQSPTADVVGVAFFVDGTYAGFGIIPPLAGQQSQPVRAQQTLALTGTHAITAVVDDINRFPESNESNNQLTRTIDFGAAVPRGLPDAVIADVRLGQGRFAPGDLVTFEAVVQNVGSNPTGDVVGVAFLVDGQYITFGTAAAIAPGATQIIRAISAWRATAGNHRLTAVVDDINRFPEESETNNQFNLDFQVRRRAETDLPDSTVDGVDFEIQPDGRTILTAAVSNIGSAPTPDVVGVAFFVDGAYATYGITQPMAAGASETIRAVKSLALQGQHTITAIVDDVNRYNEISHRNNTFRRTITVPLIERRAIWITRYDWTDQDRPADPQRIDQMVDNIARAGFNTILFQIRSAGEAYYTPGLEPWAARLTGSTWSTLGQDPGWDPLARMLEKAHAAGLEVHAYVNTYTAWLPPANAESGKRFPPATNPPHLFDRLTYGASHAEHPGEFGLGWTWRQYSDGDTPMPVQWGRYLWASPGVDEVQNHIVAVVKDIVTRYAVDGIHLDHARYAGKEYSFDPPSVAAAGAEKTAERDQWQRDRVTSLVRRLYLQTKALRPDALVSAAVWPYYVDKWNWGLSEGLNEYYQDSKGWLAAGIIDAIMPMLYDGKADDFSVWQTLAEDFLADSAKRQVIPGIGGAYNDFAEIARRIEAARQAGAPGHAIFSYESLNQHGYWDALAAGPYAVPAVPAIQAVKK